MKKRVSVKDSIAMQIWKIVFFFYFIVTLGLTLVQLGIEYRNEEAQLNEELLLFQRIVESTLGGPLWHNDYDQLKVSLQGMLRNTNIIGLKINETETGKLLGAIGYYQDQEGHLVFKAQVEQDTPVRQKQNLFSQRLLIYQSPINYLGLQAFPVAEATVYSSVSVIIDRVWWEFVVVLINAMIKTMALWAIYLWVSRRLLTRPLATLTKAANQIELGELEKFELPLQTKKKNELGILGHAFSSMVGNLLSARQSMEKSHEQTQNLADDLARTNQLKDEFIADTTHELRTPLNGMISISESLLEGVAGPLTPQQEWNLSMIRKSGRGLSNLINDLQDFTHIQQKVLYLQIQSVDLNGILHMLSSSFESVLQKKALDLHLDLPEDLPKVQADEGRLQQILFNLISNAVKFTMKGQIRISLVVENEKVQISIQDTGIGIPPELQERIFQPFEQIYGSMTAKYGGSGLRLAITKQLVELHGGTLSLQSAKEEGTHFSFTIPVATTAGEVESTPAFLPPSLFKETNVSFEHPNTPPQFPQTDTSTLSHVEATILVVDDEEVNLQIMKNFLELHQYRVILAHNGAQALEIAKEEALDLILLDVMMPYMSGYEVCRKMREKHDRFELPILMLSSKKQVQDFAIALDSGANDYVSKPFYKEELLARVQSQLQAKKAVDHYSTQKYYELRDLDAQLDFLPDKLLDQHQTPELRQALVTVLSQAVILWEEETGKSKVEFAESSELWKVYLDAGTYRTRTLDKYLNLRNLPKHPKWRTVLDSAHFILNACATAETTELESSIADLKTLLLRDASPEL